jgi:hypothetical protein
MTNSDTQSGTGVGVYTYQPAPTYTSISPSTGFAIGGTAVTITGTNFLTGAVVTIGGNNCGSLTVVSSTSITCTTIAHAAGSTNVVITNTDSQAATGTSVFTFQDAPTVTSVSPIIGSINGGTSLTITGTAFTAGATVLVDGVSCTGVVIVSSTSITCTTGARAASTGNVVVTNTDTQAGTAISAYTYASMADLKWQIGIASPNPPNPDSYGTTSTNVTHTYTLKNTGDLTTTAITISKTGAAPAAWQYGTDSCQGATLAAGASCTVQVTFLGQFLSLGSYSATLEATAATGGTTTNAMSGSVP